MNLEIIEDNPKVGIVIGTRACLPYIHLQLETTKRYYPENKILIRDDGSNDTMILNDLCQKYNVDFSTSNAATNIQPKQRRIGDTACFYHGLLWAKRNKINILVKMSRRWIICENFIPNLISLAKKTQYPTYSNGDSYVGFRTELTALHVKSWYCQSVVNSMKKFMKMDYEDRGGVEAFIHNLAINVHKNNPCDVNNLWEKHHGHLDRGGYGIWDTLGKNRENPPKNVLWHKAHKPEVYYNKSLEYNLPYTIEDFKRVTETEVL